MDEYTNRRPYASWMKKMSKSNTRKKWENIYQMCTKWKVHIFNVWTAIMQSLNKKEWKLLELQITQTRHPKSVVDRPSEPTTRPVFAKLTWVII